MADPLVRENATVKLAEHTYVIPDGNVGLVPNVGIVVGSRATLVIDPGLGPPQRRNGAARGGEGQQEQRAVHRLHALPCRAHHRVPRVSRDREVRQLDGAGGRVRRGRRGADQELLRPVADDRGTAEGRHGPQGRHHVRSRATRSTWAACACGCSSWARRTRAATPGFFVEGDGVLFAGDVVMNNSFLAGEPGVEHARRGWPRSTHSRR